MDHPGSSSSVLDTLYSSRNLASQRKWLDDKTAGQHRQVELCLTRDHLIVFFFFLTHTDSLIVNNSWKEQKKLIVRFMKEVGKKSHRRYVLSYYACEVLAFSALVSKKGFASNFTATMSSSSSDPEHVHHASSVLQLLDQLPSCRLCSDE